MILQDLPGLRVLDAGTTIPQSAIFDLKTRSITREGAEDKAFSAQLPRLWVRQIPNLILAFHKQGDFQTVNVNDVTNAISTWEDLNQKPLRRFAELLRRIIAAVNKAPEGKMEITLSKRGGECFAFGSSLGMRLLCFLRILLRGGRIGYEGVTRVMRFNNSPHTEEPPGWQPMT